MGIAQPFSATSVMLVWPLVKSKLSLTLFLEIFFIILFQNPAPCAQSALNMVDEDQVISHMQTAEAVLSSPNCTLHSDGNSRDHKKIVGMQLSLAN